MQHREVQCNALLLQSAFMCKFRLMANEATPKSNGNSKIDCRRAAHPEGLYLSAFLIAWKRTLTHLIHHQAAQGYPCL